MQVGIQTSHRPNDFDKRRKLMGTSTAKKMNQKIQEILNAPSNSPQLSAKEKIQTKIKEITQYIKINPSINYENLSIVSACMAAAKANPTDFTSSTSSPSKIALSVWEQHSDGVTPNFDAIYSACIKAMTQIILENKVDEFAQIFIQCLIKELLQEDLLPVLVEQLNAADQEAILNELAQQLSQNPSLIPLIESFNQDPNIQILEATIQKLKNILTEN